MPTSATEHQVIEQTVKMPLDHYQMIVENNRMLKEVIDQIKLKPWLTTAEAAAYINQSVTHLRGRLKDEIGFQKSGKELNFRRVDLDRYLMKDYRPAKD